MGLVTIIALLWQPLDFMLYQKPKEKSYTGHASILVKLILLRSKIKPIFMWLVYLRMQMIKCSFIVSFLGERL